MYSIYLPTLLVMIFYNISVAVNGLPCADCHKSTPLLTHCFSSFSDTHEHEDLVMGHEMCRPVATLRHEEAVASSFLIDTINFVKKSLKIWLKILQCEVDSQ